MTIFKGPWPVLVLGALVGCAQAPAQPLCPAYVDYGHADQQALLKALQSVPDNDSTQPLWQALRDYGKLRAAVRVLCGGGS
ncbi:hypothetical protein E3E12_06070 [Formicincola oecophyllae]|uniref:Uncharacterized protein n=1 Tax=Formicincola oecophyllae TaxID=2558361 RepID=A0A4Y6U8X1_9PROT|nr:hypothetical protein [Formicincola oecophyllae]QDH13822.1 hypothetical protein E3E12_06070 [Formicincola oecophyllae]